MGVDAEGFGPARRSPAVRASLLRHVGGTARTTLLFYAGRLSPEKNIGLLSDALRELSRDRSGDYRLVVEGAGPDADRLRGHGQHIWLCGNLDRETLADYCASCDVFVHPNPREPFGIGPLEAMASGAAPIARSVPETTSSIHPPLGRPSLPTMIVPPPVRRAKAET